MTCSLRRGQTISVFIYLSEEDNQGGRRAGRWTGRETGRRTGRRTGRCTCQNYMIFKWKINRNSCFFSFILPNYSDYILTISNIRMHCIQKFLWTLLLILRLGVGAPNRFIWYLRFYMQMFSVYTNKIYRTNLGMECKFAMLQMDNRE